MNVQNFRNIELMLFHKFVFLFRWYFKKVMLSQEYELHELVQNEQRDKVTETESER